MKRLSNIVNLKQLKRKLFKIKKLHENNAYAIINTQLADCNTIFSENSLLSIER